MSDAAALAAPQIQAPPSLTAGLRLRVREVAEADHEAVARLLAKGFERPSWYYAEALRRLSRHPPRRGDRSTVS